MSKSALEITVKYLKNVLYYENLSQGGGRSLNDAIDIINDIKLPDRTQIRKEVCEEILYEFPKEFKSSGCGATGSGSHTPPSNAEVQAYNNAINQCKETVLRIRDKEELNEK